MAVQVLDCYKRLSPSSCWQGMQALGVYTRSASGRPSGHDRVHSQSSFLETVGDPEPERLEGRMQVRLRLPLLQSLQLLSAHVLKSVNISYRHHNCAR
jgi:hypothetical protein